MAFDKMIVKKLLKKFDDVPFVLPKRIRNKKSQPIMILAMNSLNYGWMKP